MAKAVPTDVVKTIVGDYYKRAAPRIAPAEVEALAVPRGLEPPTFGLRSGGPSLSLEIPPKPDGFRAIRVRVLTAGWLARGIIAGTYHARQVQSRRIAFGMGL